MRLPILNEHGYDAYVLIYCLNMFNDTTQQNVVLYILFNKKKC